jgi:hypothetical protein
VKTSASGAMSPAEEKKSTMIVTVRDVAPVGTLPVILRHGQSLAPQHAVQQSVLKVRAKIVFSK